MKTLIPLSCLDHDLLSSNDLVRIHDPLRRVKRPEGQKKEQIKRNSMKLMVRVN